MYFNSKSKDADKGFVEDDDEFFEPNYNVNLDYVYSSASSNHNKEGRVINMNKNSKEKDSNMMIIRK